MIVALLLALLLGIAGGMRTFMPVAAVALASWLGAMSVAGGPFAFFASPWAAGILTLLALMELAGDKHPRTPSRTMPAPVVGRIASGALAGAALAWGEAGIALGALAGGLGAAASTYGCHAIRAALAKSFGKDLPAALIEDLAAIVLAASAVSLAA